VTVRSVILSITISALRNMNITKKIDICLPKEKSRHVCPYKFHSKNNMNSQCRAKVIFQNQRKVQNISLIGTGFQ